MSLPDRCGRRRAACRRARGKADVLIHGSPPSLIPRPLIIHDRGQLVNWYDELARESALTAPLGRQATMARNAGAHCVRAPRSTDIKRNGAADVGSHSVPEGEQKANLGGRLGLAERGSIELDYAFGQACPNLQPRLASLPLNALLFILSHRCGISDCGLAAPG